MAEWELAETAHVDLTAHTVTIDGNDFPYLLGCEPVVRNAENDVSTLVLTVLVGGDITVTP